MTGWLRAASVKLYGEPPPKDAPRSIRLYWIRRLSLRLMLFTLPVYACIFLFAEQTWVLIVVAAGVLLWLESVVSLSFRIRRERRRERMP
jgi:hypothetical protein